MALSDITPIKRSEEYLQRIADAIENSGGSDLPAVTSDDNGDVLTVVNGVWDKASPAGGGGVKIIELVENTDTNNNCDALIKYGGQVLETYAEVSAFISESPVVLAIIVSSPDSTNILVPTSSTIISESTSAYYTLSAGGNSMTAGYQAK